MIVTVGLPPGAEGNTLTSHIQVLGTPYLAAVIHDAGCGS